MVEIRTKEEILATLDRDGCVDGLPFMPEMLQYCGKQFQVSAVAHKTCDTSHGTWANRRLRSTVHLKGLRCDGSAHGGCQAECNLFWKDKWLKRVGVVAGRTARMAGKKSAPSIALAERRLVEATRQPTGTDANEPRYLCQTTQLFDATESMAWWDLRQYVLDAVTGNHSYGRVLRVLWLAAIRWIQPRVPFGYRFALSLRDWMYRTLAGRSSPSVNGRIKRGLTDARRPSGPATGRMGSDQIFGED